MTSRAWSHRPHRRREYITTRRTAVHAIGGRGGPDGAVAVLPFDLHKAETRLD
jgi:hypothetical protein